MDLPRLSRSSFPTGSGASGLRGRGRCRARPSGFFGDEPSDGAGGSGVGPCRRMRLAVLHGELLRSKEAGPSVCGGAGGRGWAAGFLRYRAGGGGRVSREVGIGGEVEAGERPGPGAAFVQRPPDGHEAVPGVARSEVFARVLRAGVSAQRGLGGGPRDRACGRPAWRWRGVGSPLWPVVRPDTSRGWEPGAVGHRWQCGSERQCAFERMSHMGGLRFSFRLGYRPGPPDKPSGDFGRQVRLVAAGFPGGCAVPGLSQAGFCMTRLRGAGSWRPKSLCGAVGGHVR